MVDYINVRADPGRIGELLSHSGGRRVVPVIVDDNGEVSIGYGGT